MIARDTRAAAVARYSPLSEDELSDVLYSTSRELQSATELFIEALIAGADTGQARAAVKALNDRHLEIQAALSARLNDTARAERRRLESAATATATHAIKRVNARLAGFVVPVPPGGGA